MSPLLSASLVLLAGMFGSRLIQDTANGKLDHDKKALLVDLFSKNRLVVLGALFATVGLFALNNQFDWVPRQIAFQLYFAAVIIFILIISINAYVKLKANAYPMGYIRALIIATAVRVVGTVLFFAMLLDEK